MACAMNSCFWIARLTIGTWPITPPSPCIVERSARASSANGPVPPAISLWLIPLMAFSILYRHRRQLQATPVPQELVAKYGFLFKGFDARHYYWEVMISFRKVRQISPCPASGAS